MLIEYFQANIDYPLAREVTYMEFPSMFTWTNGMKKMDHSTERVLCRTPLFC
jgi:hypothetical protein